MRLVIQRVQSAAVTIAGQPQAAIGRGLLVLVGFRPGDGDAELQRMTRRLPLMRLFEDGQGRMNASVADVDGAILLVPNFTLYADTRRGRRPGFSGAAPPEVAKPLFERFSALLSQAAVPVRCGVFGADMQVDLCNDGPVTVILED